MLNGKSINIHGNSQVNDYVPIPQLPKNGSSRGATTYHAEMHSYAISIHGLGHCHLHLQDGQDHHLQSLHNCYETQCTGLPFKKIQNVKLMAISQDNSQKYFV